MAIAFVQNAHSGSSSSTTHTIGISASGAGNLIVLAIGYDISNTTSVSSITDNVGNTYQQVPGAIGGISLSEDSTIWYAKNSTAGCTSITIHYSAMFGHSVVSVYEFSGADTTAPADAGFGETLGGTYHSPAITPSTTQELLVSLIYSTAQVMTGADAPWIAVPDASEVGFASAYYINPPISVQQTVFTPHGSGDHSACMASFFAVTGPLTKLLTETQSVSALFSPTTKILLSELVRDSDIFSGSPLLNRPLESVKIADWFSITRSQDDSPFGD